jgi:hypothetical protein
MIFFRAWKKKTKKKPHIPVYRADNDRNLFWIWIWKNSCYQEVRIYTLLQPPLPTLNPLYKYSILHLWLIYWIYRPDWSMNYCQWFIFRFIFKNKHLFCSLWYMSRFLSLSIMSLYNVELRFF